MNWDIYRPCWVFCRVASILVQWMTYNDTSDWGGTDANTDQDIVPYWCGADLHGNIDIGMCLTLTGITHLMLTQNVHTYIKMMSIVHWLVWCKVVASPGMAVRATSSWWPLSCRTASSVSLLPIGLLTSCGTITHHRSCTLCWQRQNKIGSGFIGQTSLR